MREPWTTARLASCFADRLSLDAAMLQTIRVEAFSAVPQPVSDDPQAWIARMLAATSAGLAGVPPQELKTFLALRDDIAASALAALQKAEDGWRYLHERGTVTVAVHVPASFLVYLRIVAARIKEEIHAAA